MNSLREVSLDKHSFPTEPDHPPRSSKFSIPPENSSIQVAFAHLHFLGSSLSNYDCTPEIEPERRGISSRAHYREVFCQSRISQRLHRLTASSNIAPVENSDTSLRVHAACVTKTAQLPQDPIDKDEYYGYDLEIESERSGIISRKRYRKITCQSHISQQLNTSTPSPTIAPVKSADTSLKAPVSSIKHIEKRDDSTDSENYYDCESDDSLNEASDLHESTLEKYVTKSNSSNSSHDLALSFPMTSTQNLTLHSLGPCVTEIERLRTEFMIAQRANNSLRMREIGLLLSRRIKAEAEADGKIQELTPFNIMMIVNAFRDEYRQFITKDGVRYKCPNFNPLRMFAEKHCAEWGYSGCGGDSLKKFVLHTSTELFSIAGVSVKCPKNPFSSSLPETHSLRELLRLNNEDIMKVPQEKIGHVYASIFLHKHRTEDESFLSSFIGAKVSRTQKPQAILNLAAVVAALDTEAHALGFIYATHVTHPGVLKSLGWTERDIRRNEVFVFCFERIPNQESTV